MALSRVGGMVGWFDISGFLEGMTQAQTEL